jgi:bile acid:Na+ symporter, BASS family
MYSPGAIRALATFASCCLVAEAGGKIPIRPLPLLNFFVVLVMLSIGLRVSSRELLGVLGNRVLFARMLLANCILVPAAGFLLVNIFPLRPEASVGILLLAAIPGTPIALQSTRMAKTRLAFAAVMTFVLSLASLAITPLALEVMPQTAQHSDRPMLQLVASILLYITAPLCAGLWVARCAPNIGPRVVRPLEILATVVFLFLMWETRLVRREALHAIAGRGTIAAMFLLLLISMLVGWLVGAGQDNETRRVLATATSMRSVVVVLYVARYCFPGTNIYMVPIVDLSLMVPTNLLFHLAFMGRHRLQPQATG